MRLISAKPIKNSLRRCYITLIELLIVIMIITAALGWMGLNVVSTLREQRFLTEVESVVNQLRLAQNLMLTLQTNVIVRYTSTPEGLERQTVFETPVPSKWEKEFATRLPPLKEIHFFEFEDKGIHRDEEVKALEIKFLFQGALMSKGILRLSTSKSKDVLGAIERFIWLPGYPYLFKSLKEYPDEEDLKKEEHFDEQLTHTTLDEIKNL